MAFHLADKPFKLRRNIATVIYPIGVSAFVSSIAILVFGATPLVALAAIAALFVAIAAEAANSITMRRYWWLKKLEFTWNNNGFKWLLIKAGRIANIIVAQFSPFSPAIKIILALMMSLTALILGLGFALGILSAGAIFLGSAFSPGIYVAAGLIFMLSVQAAFSCLENLARINNICESEARKFNKEEQKKLALNSVGITISLGFLILNIFFPYMLVGMIASATVGLFAHGNVILTLGLGLSLAFAIGAGFNRISRFFMTQKTKHECSFVSSSVKPTDKYYEEIEIKNSGNRVLKIYTSTQESRLINSSDLNYAYTRKPNL